MTCQFVSLTEERPGTIFRLLQKSYAVWAEEELSEPDELAEWYAYDREAFLAPDSVGACLFFTRCDQRTVGFASWDPRQAPEVGIVGHNCVLPEFRGRGLGARQLREVLRRFQQKRIRIARVTTLDHPFFVPAQRMYQACGFREVRRTPWPRHPSICQVTYEQTLCPPAESPTCRQERR